jgi:hypothetical protein
MLSIIVRLPDQGDGPASAHDFEGRWRRERGGHPNVERDFGSTGLDPARPVGCANSPTNTPPVALHIRVSRAGTFARERTADRQHHDLDQEDDD